MLNKCDSLFSDNHNTVDGCDSECCGKWKKRRTLPFVNGDYFEIKKKCDSNLSEIRLTGNFAQHKQKAKASNHPRNEKKNAERSTLLPSWTIFKNGCHRFQLRHERSDECRRFDRQDTESAYAVQERK